MTTENFGRRSSDEILIRLDAKTDEWVKNLDRLREWIGQHEERIQVCEKQHVGNKAVIASVKVFMAIIVTIGGAISTVVAVLLSLFFGSKH